VQGNIVIGHTTNYEVGPENAQYLRRLSRKLAADLNSDIQLEFVIDKKRYSKNSTVTRAKKQSCKQLSKKRNFRRCFSNRHNILQSHVWRQHTTRARRHSYSGARLFF
jgi:hypothetical protein